MSFFTDNHGRSYPISGIVKIGLEQPADSGSFLPYHRVELRGAAEVKVYPAEVRRICQSSDKVIPALPETFRLSLRAPKSLPPERWWMVREPVIAWRIERDDTCIPITIETCWNRSSYDYSAVQMPDGLILHEDGNKWSSLSEFEKDVRNWMIADREDLGEELVTAEA